MESKLNLRNKEHTLRRDIIEIIEWAESKWGVGECTDNMIVPEIKKLIKYKEWRQMYRLNYYNREKKVDE